ncbi:sodium/hydrogen exchanger 2-like [Lates japonicus]|uniref:Sodium/hydrogen exchanger 2-like protein n=1 Tax=Lates japonicus TaxID=270547 RepID=A0AAD3NNP0_LATJO|nr:sodium/hydrogen exchanger 2-like protein [Lates japonicus]GLD74344.1 sodium/hydrogen exchanger 2-like protein [Lates japonicus]
MARRNNASHPFYPLQVTPNQSSARGRAQPVSELMDAPQVNYRCVVWQCEGDSASVAQPCWSSLEESVNAPLLKNNEKMVE